MAVLASDDSISCTHHQQNSTNQMEHVGKYFGEADLTVILNIESSVKVNYKRLILLSNDTDVLIVVLHYMEYFTSIGLNELWMQFGTGKCTRFLPVHALLIQLGLQLCPIFIKCHVLTRTDNTRKTSTKSAALTSDPNKYFQNFGSDDCLEIQFQNAGEYLIRVLQTYSKSLNLDDITIQAVYEKVSLVELRPMPSTINGHLERSY